MPASSWYWEMPHSSPKKVVEMMYNMEPGTYRYTLWLSGKGLNICVMEKRVVF
jgi:hypothetical protein